VNKDVLIVYASKNGSTAEIAERIGQVIREAGIPASVQPAKQVKNLEDYQAVVLGSAVYYGRWQKDAVSFLKKFEKELSQNPTWFFSSGPVGEGDPVELLDGWRFPPLQQEIADRIGPRDTAVFHGVLRDDNLNFFERWVMKNFESPEGDFRDWEAISAWARRVADQLKQK
jgi:menaquinone-dependent protoporphyrinogen oxidase